MPAITERTRALSTTVPSATRRRTANGRRTSNRQPDEGTGRPQGLSGPLFLLGFSLLPGVLRRLADPAPVVGAARRRDRNRRGMRPPPRPGSPGSEPCQLLGSAD